MITPDEEVRIVVLSRHMAPHDGRQAVAYWPTDRARTALDSGEPADPDPTVAIPRSVAAEATRLACQRRKLADAD